LTVDFWPGFPGQAGFTLIELAAVVAILAIVIAAGLPAFSRFQKKTALSAEGTRMVHSLRYAQQRSVLERETMEVVFDLDNKAYWIPVIREEIRREPGRGRVRTPRRQKEFASFHQKIPSDYTIDLFYYAGVDREVRKGETAVKFYPDGTADEVYITLLRRSEDPEDDMRIFIKVSGVTGLVKVHEGRGEYEGWDFFDGRLDDKDELS
jgi:prepilin-type N-terminal cleavage/methylation domain-containing protein